MNSEELDFFRHAEKEGHQNLALNLIKSLDDRCLGHLKANVKAEEHLELCAEEELIRKEKYHELRCEMPGMPRSTFLMVFSPDGTKVASTHGNHNIYVTDLRNGRNVKTLVGHPRTPWCIAFHPTSNQIVASGCLGGQVRIWDLSGGSEVWTAGNQSVIASIAFHPNDRILVIATVNEVYFWDWSKPEPFCHTATGNQKEKVRYVAFDKLGHKLITGISNSQNRWDYVRQSVPVARPSERTERTIRRSNRVFNIPARNTQPAPQAPPANNAREFLSSVPERERNITVCYRNLVREYGRLVQRYLQLYRPPAMIDRGTDPMEQNNLSRSTNSTQMPEQSDNPQPGTSRSANTDNPPPPPPPKQDQPSTSNHNPYQLFTPSRILAAMNRPSTLIRGTQTETRKHKVDNETAEEIGGGKKQRINDSASNSDLLANSFPSSDANRTDIFENESPQPCSSGSTQRKPNITDNTDEEQVLEDIISGSSSSKEKMESSGESNFVEPSTSMKYSAATSPSVNIRWSPRTSSTSKESSTKNEQNSGSPANNFSAPSTSRTASKNALMEFLNKLPKVSKGTQKFCSKSGSESSSNSDKSDNDLQTIGKKSANPPEEQRATSNSTDNDTRPGISSNESYVSNNSQRQPEARSSQASGTPIDYSLPGTSRGDTSGENVPREEQRLELMMMNIRKNAEEKLRSRFLPLISSVPENDRLELIRLFERGVSESREKARLRYRNMGQMFIKKQNRRPLLDTSSDSSSSEDERDPLHINYLNNQSSQSQTDQVRTEGSNNSNADNFDEDRSLETGESTNRDAYHNINNLENWVTSLFDDIGSQRTSGNDTATTSTTRMTTASTSSAIDDLLDRPPQPTRVPTRLSGFRRLYTNRILRDRITPVTSNTIINSANSNSAGSGGNTRTTNSAMYTFARRRLNTPRASAFLPTRVYYPRTPPEFRRSRQFSLNRWRLNQRPYRSCNLSDRPIITPLVNTNSNFASDEVINFSELPNSEDDPVPSFERPSPNVSSSLYQFHPFNPPPDLPTINPENIGIGNMYSNIVQDLENSLNDVRNIRAANRPGEMSDMLSNFSERLENIMNQSETILRNLRTSVEMLPGSDTNDNGGQSGSVPIANFVNPNFYVRDRRAEANDLDRSIENLMDVNLSQNATSDHTYPRNSNNPVSPSNSGDSMSPLMTSLHLTISHIQRQARLLRQQVESIERIDRAMVEVAQLQLMRLLLVELSRYIRNMSGESRSTCMSSVRQMMAGTRISDSSPSESPSNNEEMPSSSSQPTQSTSGGDNSNSMPSARTRGVAHKTYPPSRLSRLQRQFYRRATLIHHVPRRYALRLLPRNASSILTPSVSLNLDTQSMLNMYSRINTFTLNRMSRRLDELINEQVRIFTQRSFVRVPPRIPGGNMGEQNLAIRLRDSITRTNRLVGSLFDANVVRNCRMYTTAISRDGVDRFHPRQALSFIIDGISSHLDETRGSPLPHNIRLQLQGVMTMSMLLSELLLLHIVDSIPPPTDMNLDQERQSLTNRIDQMCTTMRLSSRYGGYSTHLTHSLRQLQTMIRQNQSSNNNSSSIRNQRRYLSSRVRTLVDQRSRVLRRMNMMNRIRNTLYSAPTRTQVIAPENRTTESPASNSVNEEADDGWEESFRRTTETRIQILRRMRMSLFDRIDDMSDRLQDNNRSHESAELDVENPMPHESGTRVLRVANLIEDGNENAQAQNSESDDNAVSRRTHSVDHQIPGTSSGVSSWQGNTLYQPSMNRPREDGRSGDTWTNNEASHSSSRPYRTSTPMSTDPSTTSNSEDWPAASRWPWNVPSVQVNDVPVSELGPSQDSSESDNPPSLGNNNNNNTFYPRGVMARLAAIRAVNHPLGVFRPRFLHPLYASVNPFDADLDDPQREHIYDSDVITTVTPNHRIQVWDISDSAIPMISNPLKNVVVGECKIHNDASVDIASDGSVLVTLLPSGGYLNVTNRLGVYSLKWETLGQCLYTTNFDHNAVSVSLSPLGRHLVVGLASRRVSIVPSERWMMARIFRIEQKDMPGDRLPVVRELDQSRDGRATSHKSVNCIRWLPTSGQGLIYGTNTGQLVIWT